MRCRSVLKATEPHPSIYRRQSMERHLHHFNEINETQPRLFVRKLLNPNSKYFYKCAENPQGAESIYYYNFTSINECLVYQTEDSL